jgi:hypothetical protein
MMSDNHREPQRQHFLSRPATKSRAPEQESAFMPSPHGSSAARAEPGGPRDAGLTASQARAADERRRAVNDLHVGQPGRVDDIFIVFVLLSEELRNDAILM